MSRPPGSKPKPLGQLVSLRAHGSSERIQYNMGNGIFGERSLAPDYIYQVAPCGSHPQSPVRLPPPDRRIPPGRLHFGVENGRLSPLPAEAIVDHGKKKKKTVRLMKRCSLEHVAKPTRGVARLLLNMTTTTSQARQPHLLLGADLNSRVGAILRAMDPADGRQ